MQMTQVECLDQPVYSVDDVRWIEETLIQQHGINAFDLMQLAARALFSAFKKLYPERRKIMVVCGPGNNGGDGLMFAYYAHQAGWFVTVYLLGSKGQRSICCRDALLLVQQENIDIQETENPGLIDQSQYEAVIDAIFGVGLSRALMQPYLQWVEWMNHSTLPVCAIDLPTGLDADSGHVWGACVLTDSVMTLMVAKTGLYLDQGPNYVKYIEVLPLLSSFSLERQLTPQFYCLAGAFKLPLPERPRDSHKGMFGRVVVIGGNEGMLGALLLAARAAQRSGAGVVQCVTRTMHAVSLSEEAPSLLVTGCESSEQVLGLLEQASIIVIGPGLGQDVWAKDMMGALSSVKCPVIFDADALNLLSLGAFNFSMEQKLLTPHPKEAARLLSVDTLKVQSARLQAAAQCSKEYGATVVLKGAGTIIHSSKAAPWVCTAGNPGMSCAGMGDVLSGLIAGLYCQGLNLLHAACYAVLLHARVADRLALESGLVGLIPEDLLQAIRFDLNGQLNESL